MRTIRISTAAVVVSMGVLALPALAQSAGASTDHRAAVAHPAPAAQHTVAVLPKASTNPIQHVVILFQENHSFDNVLGKLCVTDHRCDGSTTGTLADGSSVPLTQAADLIPNVAHSTQGQNQAIDNGKMDGWQRMSGCGPNVHYQCLSQYDPTQIPNLSALARQYAISDRTFEMDRILTFGAHVELASANLDGFSGAIPNKPSYATKSGPGWGCNSYKVTSWRPTPTSPYQDVPPCIPNPDGTGSWWDDKGPSGFAQKSPVPHVTNIFDGLDSVGKSWKVYNTIKAFDLCSYFSTCLHSVQSKNVVPSHNVITDAQSGKLANVNFVLPDHNKTVGFMDQHNLHSMAAGDNWIGDVVSAIQHGPQWSSTAIFITYDDCGCFYDHVPPPNSRMGVRLPMVIVSPYVKPGFTDSNDVGFVGMLAFTEHVFGVPAMSADDANSYDYSDSFDFTGPPHLTSTPTVHTSIAPKVLKVVRKAKLDLTDPDDVT